MTKRRCTACGGPASPQWALCSICRKAADALAPFVPDADDTSSDGPRPADAMRAEAWERGVDPDWEDGQQNVLAYGFDLVARATADIDEPSDDARRKAWLAVRRYLGHIDKSPTAMRCDLCDALIPTHGEYAVLRPDDDGCGYCGEMRRRGIRLCRPCVELMGVAGMSPFGYWGDQPYVTDDWAADVLHRACRHHDGDLDGVRAANAYAWRSGMYRVAVLADGDRTIGSLDPYAFDGGCEVCRRDTYCKA